MTSPYLAQALSEMQQAPPAPAGPEIDPQAMMSALKQRKAWEVQNPGQSYAMNGLRQMGQNIKGIPDAFAAAPGNAMGGLMSLGRSVLRR